MTSDERQMKAVCNDSMIEHLRIDHQVCDRATAALAKKIVDLEARLSAIEQRTQH